MTGDPMGYLLTFKDKIFTILKDWFQIDHMHYKWVLGAKIIPSQELIITCYSNTRIQYLETPLGDLLIFGKMFYDARILSSNQSHALEMTFWGQDQDQDQKPKMIIFNIGDPKGYFDIWQDFNDVIIFISLKCMQINLGS